MGWLGWLLYQHSRACGVWVAVVDRRRLTLRAYPDQVTLHSGGGLLLRSPIPPDQPAGMIAATLPGSGRQLVVRYARDGETTTAALWADDALIAGSLVDPTSATAADAARDLSARLRAAAEVRHL